MGLPGYFWNKTSSGYVSIPYIEPSTQATTYTTTYTTPRFLPFYYCSRPINKLRWIKRKKK